MVFPAVALVALAAHFSAAAIAQTYPAKPVRRVLTYPPGGSSYLVGRVLAQKLAERWSQQVIVENKGGAAGSIGMEYAARLPADGYSFVIGNLGPERRCGGRSYFPRPGPQRSWPG